MAIYVYDELNQLDLETRYTYTNASAIPTTTTVVDYTIDTAGNLSSVSGGEHSISYIYSNQAWSDLLTGITVDEVSRTISYASAGNPSNWYNGSDYSNLVWEQGRRLSSITKHLSSGVRTYSYAYDMSGVRSSKSIEITVDGILRHRRYDYVTQNGKVVRETAYYTDGDGEFMHCMDFFYDENGNPFAMRKYSDETLSSYNTYYYVLNAQGDVVKLIAPSGNVYAEYSYDAWGNILDSSGSLRNTNPLRYRGYYYDKETGFYYLQSRYYDPSLGRFINADSYASTGQGFLGYNMFAYCKNSPTTTVDFSGHYCVCVAVCDGGSSSSQSKPKDITKEFTELMRTHANQLVNHLFFAWMDYSDRYSKKEAYGKAFMDTMWFFAQQVKTDGEWDLKNGKDYPYYEEFVFNGQVLNGQDLGNIHYGFVGASVIPKRSILHFFAGLYQVYSGTKREYAFWFFDEPRDYEMIDYGFDLYMEDRYGYGG